MPIEETHQMRLECAKSFGTLQSELVHIKDRRKEDWDELREIKHELHKLVGNGNRGRIDDIVSEMASMKSEVTSFKAKSESGDTIISNDLRLVSKRLDSLESKFWWVVVKVIAPLFVGMSALNIFIQYAMKHLLGG